MEGALHVYMYNQSTGVGLLMWYDGGNYDSRIKAFKWNGSTCNRDQM